MPQVEQIQTYYWGALRADAIELATDGINVATGPNGSGKTTSLDALKLMLGISDLARRPAEYIYAGGEAGQRAPRALVKAVFANPHGPGRSGRIFSAAGRGCEAADHVTAVCEVTRDGKRRYAMLPGATIWGADGRDLEADIQAMRARITHNQWQTPRAWGELLNRAGVSKALLGVIAVKQGETDKTIEGSPEALLKRVLELTGKQETLDEFRAAKVNLLTAKVSYDEVNERLTSERRQLTVLASQVRLHQDFVEQRERKEWIEQAGLPAATRIEKTAARAALVVERDGQANRLQLNREEHARLEESIPQLRDRAAALEEQAGDLDGRGREAREAHTQAADAHAEAKAAVEASGRLIDAAREIVGDGPLDDAVAAAAANAAARARDELGEAQRERDELEREAGELEAGRPLRPAELDTFRERLAVVGIESTLVAEHLEAEPVIPAEAVLGDGVWGLVVDAARLDDAVGLAREYGYRLPLIAAGDGDAAGALAGATGLDAARAYLAEIDLPLATPGVSDEGVVRGEYWAALRAPLRPVLGARARAERLASVRARQSELEALLPELSARGAEAQRRALAVVQAVPAAAAIEQQEETLGVRRQVLTEARRAVEEIAGERDPIGRELGRIETQLEGQEARLSELAREITTRAPQVEGYDRRLALLDEELEALPELPADLDTAALGSVDALTHELERIEERLADEERFPQEVRSELVLAHEDAQRRKVDEVSELLAGRRDDLDAVATEVERARERYDQHIREVVGLLSRRFREVCEQAGMDGDIDLRSSEVEGEFGIDVKVAHVRGEPKRSYRSSAHSSGQRAKISLLILLAAMGLEGSADLLIMDEHAAHLDSRNIDAVAEVMNALKHRVQFILATPTNAEAGRLAWCDHQIAYYPRPAGEAFAPPIRLFTRRPVDGERYAEMGQLALAN